MKGVDNMDFAKGALIGIVAGTVVGVMNRNYIMSMIKDGKNKMKKMKKKYGI